MKILIMSLLRVGDLVLSSTVLRGLRDRFADAEIHCLINEQCIKATPLITYIDRWIPFERHQIQSGLGDATIPVFDSYERLSELIDRLNSESYDLTINLTHNRLSGWLMGLTDSKRRLGLSFDDSGQASFGSRWFRYLNDQVELESSGVFHFTDVFRFALEIGSEFESPTSGRLLAETPAGQKEAEAFLRGVTLPAVSAAGQTSEPVGPKILVVQPLTSDEKKDWGLSRYLEALSLFARTNDSMIVILGAPFEKEKLTPFVESLVERGLKARLAILSLEGAYSLLKRSDLLLTGDTSIKHLACAAETPVIEISIGSADYRRTGAYQHGSVIIQSKESCAPCVVTKLCHRSAHACAKSIPVEAVAMTLSEIFANRAFQLRQVAEEYSQEIGIFRVESSTAGFWTACPVVEQFSDQSVGHWLDLSCRKIWLQSADRGDVSLKVKGTQALIANEVRHLAGFLRANYPTTSVLDWRHLLDSFESQSQFIEGSMAGLKATLRTLNGCFEDPQKSREFVRGLIAVRERIRHIPSLASFKSALDSVIEDEMSAPLIRFRRVINVVVEIDQRAHIALCIIRGLSAEFERSEEVSKT